MNGAGPWLALAGLGAFHGLNPAMGWLFAVALGQHRRSRRTVLMALVPIAVGHALSILSVVVVLIALGLVIDLTWLGLLAGGVLLGWAAYHAVYGHRHRVRFGMQTGMAGPAVWSFLMAGSHGAGLMLVPILLPICGASAVHEIAEKGSLTLSLAAVGLHSVTMLVVTGACALVVYQWLGLGFLRRGWINLDLIWTAALAATGLLLLYQAVA